MSTLSDNRNFSQVPTNILSYDEELEVKYYQIQKSHAMSTLFPPQNEQEFATLYPNLSLAAQHLFRLLESWKHLECYPSQTLLGRMIGKSREWVNKLLKMLSDLKIVVKHYRHRQTCIYFIPHKFRGLTWEKIKKMLLKSRDFTPHFTPSFISTKNNNLSKKPRVKSGSKKEKPPNHLCHFREFKEKHPDLGQLFMQDPKRWWNMAAFPEYIFHRVVDEFDHMISKNSLRRPWDWFMSRLLKLTPQKEQDWSKAGRCKKRKGLVTI
jgi:hypothetical protein